MAGFKQAVFGLAAAAALACAPIAPAAAGGHASTPRAAHPARGDLHPRGEPDDPQRLAAVPAPGGVSCSADRRRAPYGALRMML